VTLIEAVQYIAVALALIVGGLVFCHQANLSARVNAQICVISRPVSESRALCSSNETLGSLPRITGSSLSQMVNRTGARLEPTLIAAGAVPSSLLHTPPLPGPYHLRNEFGGSIVILDGQNAAGQLSLVVALSGVPTAACNRLQGVNPPKNGQGAVSDGIRSAALSTGPTAVIFQDGTKLCASAPNMNMLWTIALK
jgi:hypothetical protein